MCALVLSHFFTGSKLMVGYSHILHCPLLWIVTLGLTAESKHQTLCIP